VGWWAVLARFVGGLVRRVRYSSTLDGRAIRGADRRMANVLLARLWLGYT